MPPVEVLRHNIDCHTDILSLIDYPKIVLENVRCSIIRPRGKGKNINKCKIKIYLNAATERDLLLLQCMHELELRISFLCGVRASIISESKLGGGGKVGIVPHTHTITFLFPAVASISMSEQPIGTLFRSTLCATLVRCDWVFGEFKGVLPRFILTSAF